MNYQTVLYRSIATIALCLTAHLSAFAAETETDDVLEAAEQQPVVIMDTFDVHANAAGFFKLIDRAIKLAREVDPEGGGATFPRPPTSRT